MQETYGILGSGNAPKKVIEAGLKDLGTKLQYVVPWYGRVTPGLEVVYDWLLDNDADFVIVSSEGGKAVPKVLAEKAESIVPAEDVNYRILKSLKTREVPGISLILWDTENEEESVRLSSMSIDMKLPTLELTNGLVPIIVEPSSAGHQAPIRDDQLPDLGEASYARETLEVMPAALVKRMAKDKGVSTKTKEEAIEVLSPKEPSTVNQPEIGSIVFLMNDGTEIGFNGTQELLNKIMEVVATHQRKW